MFARSMSVVKREQCTNFCTVTTITITTTLLNICGGLRRFLQLPEPRLSLINVTRQADQSPCTPACSCLSDGLVPCHSSTPYAVCAQLGLYGMHRNAEAFPSLFTRPNRTTFLEHSDPSKSHIFQLFYPTAWPKTGR